MPNAQATPIPAQASSKSKVAFRLLISTPRALGEPPKYSPAIAPIIARTVAILRAVKMKGSAVGKRTRRKMATSPAAYDLMSSIDAGRTEVRPRTVLTKTGKKQRTAAIAIFDVLPNGPNHAFVIGAKAMIGTALAAIAYGISARPRRRERAPRGIGWTATGCALIAPPRRGRIRGEAPRARGSRARSSAAPRASAPCAGTAGRS